MFVIVHDNSVILGPMRWNKFRFENVIAEECEFTVSLPSSNDQPIIVSENIKILPVQGTQNPVFNSTIEFLNGPFWEFTDTAAIQSFRVENIPVEAIKNTLKALTSAVRWKRETAGIKVTVQDTEVSVVTERGDRDIFVQKFLLMGDAETVQWKFPEGWIVLTKAHLGAIVTAGAQHVQDQFVWEALKIAEIEACTTHSELAGIVIEEPSMGIGAL